MNNLNSRIWIENITPQLDGGKFPIKRTVGETVRVQADVFLEGTCGLEVMLCYRIVREKAWTEVSMTHLGNDTWEGEFCINELKDYEYTVSAWVDSYRSWKNFFQKKINAEQDITLEILEGVQIVKRLTPQTPRQEQKWLNENLLKLKKRPQVEHAIEFFLSARLEKLARMYQRRMSLNQHELPLRVHVDRERARFSNWYEMFPRSQLPVDAQNFPLRSATFHEAENALPRIAAMGFNILYLPPIHPIGHTARKGKNNSLHAENSEPGCPWAIGNKHGGHRSIDPALGTITDFHKFQNTAQELGIELALDLAFQCSPDHPYVQKHKNWFYIRPDGSIHYAENPPKQYQDIFPLNFSCSDWKSLWEELKSVVEYWVKHGVKVFRVDNPHTKPFAFWEWLIKNIREKNPEVIFLSEAFTRPKPKYALAKLGFQQSYTYFTWRNTKHEIQDYLQELTSYPTREFFRPNFFANTPDILPEYLQHAPKSAFEIRLILAATLSSSYGIYSGFELLENDPFPGREEYNNNEKYEIKPRNWNQGHSIQPLITTINSLREDFPALQFTSNIEFCRTNNEQIIAYRKLSPDKASFILCVVTLDPNTPQEAMVSVPMNHIGLNENSVYDARDLLTGISYQWSGTENYVRLDPAVQVAHLFYIANS